MSGPANTTMVPSFMDKFFLEVAILDPGVYDPMPPGRGATAEFIQRQTLIRSLQTFYRQLCAETMPATDDERVDLTTPAKLRRELIPIVTPYLGPLETSPTFCEIPREPRLKACLAAYIFVNRRQQVDILVKDVRRHVMNLVSFRRHAGRIQRESISDGGADYDDEETLMDDDDDPDYAEEGSDGRGPSKKVIVMDQAVHENDETGGEKNGEDVGGKETEVVTAKKRKLTEETSIVTATTSTTTVRWSADSASADVKVSRSSNGDVDVAFTSAQAGTVTIDFKISHEV